MILFMFAIRDHKVDAFSNPMFLQSRGQAMRVFSDEVNREDKENMLFRHPEDFTLYYLGEFDTTSGVVVCEKVEQMVVASDVKIKK